MKTGMGVLFILIEVVKREENHGSNIPMETVRIIVGHSGKGVTEQVYLSKEPWELVKAINTIEIPW